MLEKTLGDITAYIDFLRADGYAVSISNFDSAFEPCLATFTMYEPSARLEYDSLKNNEDIGCCCSSEAISKSEQDGQETGSCYFGEEKSVTAIKHGDKVIVYIHVSDCKSRLTEQKAYAIATPLEYMFERLYEECCEYNAHNTVMDAYKKSLIYIRDHYMEGISVADVAKGIGYSVSYFGYIFKKNRGISANKYINELQLAKATELLIRTSLSVSDIAERVGFGDANYFSTAFRSQYGMSPRQYRNHNKQ